MTKNVFRFTAPLLGLMVLALGWSGGAGAAESFKLKMQTAVPGGSPHSELLQRFADNVENMSNGRVKIEVLPDGAVVGTHQILDAVNKGLVEMGFAWTHFWTGKNPAAGLFSAPLSGAGTGLDQLGHLSWMMQGEGKDLYKELYQKKIGFDVVAFQAIPDGPEALGWFKKPIKSMAEFRKLKFRSPPGLPGQAYTEIGVSVVSMPGVEIMPAAERGVIDAGEWINPAADLALGFHDIFKFYSLQGLHQAIDVGDIYINGKVWRKMPKDLQAIIEVAAKASVIESLTFFVKANSEALQVLLTEKGVTLFDAPNDYPPQFVKAANTVIERYMKDKPFFKKVVLSMRKFAGPAVPYRVETLKQSLLMGEAGLKARK